jgi:hypothetical protein
MKDREKKRHYKHKKGGETVCKYIVKEKKGAAGGEREGVRL